TTEENFNIDADLALFTNTQFFDFDSGQNTDFQAQPVKPEADASLSSPSADVSAAASVMGDMPNLDFMQTRTARFACALRGGQRWRWGILTNCDGAIPRDLVVSCLGPLRWRIARQQATRLLVTDGGMHAIADEFNFSEFNNGYTAPQMNNFAEANHNFQPLQPNHTGAQVPHTAVQFHGEKRKSEVMAAPAQPQGVNYEDGSRVAAEEDKRRRNTAASARFRIKKKQREQALEKSAKEMTDKVNGLEAKVSQLETENKWLKNLLVEKNEGNEDISALWKEFTKQASTKLKPESSTGAGVKNESR
ncbi:hypothetical protein Golomagni_06388, partial [Golovinomyces magnicellulatus]